MARPARSKREEFRGGMRSAALMHQLASRLGAKNPYHFARLFDDETGLDTKWTGKWRKNFNGEKPLSEGQLRLLSCLDPSITRLHEEGPSNLWIALWGDVSDLWTLCRTRYCSVFDDRLWSQIDSEYEFSTERNRHGALRVLEDEITAAEDYGEPLFLSHLTESIMLYRLFCHANIASPDKPGVQAYRCIHRCLDSIDIWYELDQLGIFYGVREEVTEMEICRLGREARYRDELGLEMHQIALYADEPLAWVPVPRAKRDVLRDIIF
ncbi:MAG: hypothetical protein N0E44_07840 [Candidatus Thiodiazotropha lotti]|nr:hypothetical protein [Candidatus Thiodiazotropha lotti]MCW4219788.1 hypothetical protein [Candidatus Thiodiazotropha lotti]